MHFWLFACRQINYSYNTYICLIKMRIRLSADSLADAHMLSRNCGRGIKACTSAANGTQEHAWHFCR